ncbi:MAG: 50S ribosomal protein L13 [Candidatus Nomurabacteria bacterium]|jgi:large subunit ribosomal protein L13|nr:50S ribosomal protein L13 [Candidatus Nomurabacteria bacterium]
MADFKTYSMKAGEVQHKWILLDATGVPVGRLASFAATRLTGKYLPSFTAHIDSGDHIVIINADQAVLTGDKLGAKKYYRHSGYPGAIKETGAKELPLSEVIARAVKGMLPKNKLQAPRLKRLHVYAGSEHSHSGQQPVDLTSQMKGEK